MGTDGTAGGPVEVDRDSVSMGDDADSHRAAVALPEGALLGEALALIRRDYPLGSNTTWAVEVDGVPVAVEGPAARLFLADPLSPFTGRSVFFRYHCRRDAEAVRAELA